MNLLVTGGAGYIGSHFCKAAARHGHRPIVFDNLSTGHRDAVKFGPFYEGDIRNTEALFQVLRDEKIEAVVHFAAKALVGESVLDPLSYYSNNTQGTLSLIQAMERSGVLQIVLSSSAATYGNPSMDFIPESQFQKPINPYGRTKLQCEEILLDAHRLLNFRVAILRYFNVIGCDPEGELDERHEPETHLVPNILRALKSGREFSVLGNDYSTSDGTCIRDYVDVNDLAEVHVLALQRIQDQPLLISNVGLGCGHSVMEVYRAFCNAFGRGPQLTVKPRRPGDPDRLIAEASYFRSWCSLPLRSLDESLSCFSRVKGIE